MPLENETQASYIDDLNVNWPAGTDSPAFGDNHIRLIKKVLKQTFPNITGPITLTQDELNRGSVPAGSRTIFFQAMAPVGWRRVTVGNDATFGIRIVGDNMSGGGAGGQHDPILNDLVPAHTHHIDLTSWGSGGHNHIIEGTTANENVGHTHWFNFNTRDDGNHQHYMDLSTSRTGVVTNSGYVPGGGSGGGNAAIGSNETHSHQVQGWTHHNGVHKHYGEGVTQGANTAHVHAMRFDSNWGGDHDHRMTGQSLGVYAPNRDSSWRPRYGDFILCEKE